MWEPQPRISAATRSLGRPIGHDGRSNESRVNLASARSLHRTRGSVAVMRGLHDRDSCAWRSVEAGAFPEAGLRLREPPREKSWAGYDFAPSPAASLCTRRHRRPSRLLKET
jgi:hypothetical protein